MKIFFNEMSLKDVYYINPTLGRNKHGTPVSNVMKILAAQKEGIFWVIKRALPFGFLFLVSVKLPGLFIVLKLVILIMFAEENSL